MISWEKNSTGWITRILTMKSSEPLHVINQESSILMIKAKDKPTADVNGDEYGKTLIRSVAKSLFSTSQHPGQRRASPRINAKSVVGQGSGARGQRGHQQATASRKSKTSSVAQKRGTADAKYPPKHHQ